MATENKKRDESERKETEQNVEETQINKKKKKKSKKQRMKDKIKMNAEKDSNNNNEEEGTSGDDTSKEEKDETKKQKDQEVNKKYNKNATENQHRSEDNKKRKSEESESGKDKDKDTSNNNKEIQEVDTESDNAKNKKQKEEEKERDNAENKRQKEEEKEKEREFKVKEDTGNKINYLKGDATLPQAKGHKIIAHICNVNGRWGKGFVLAVTQRFGKVPQQQYFQWHKERSTNNFKLGSVQFVSVSPHITIANILAQKGLAKRRKTGPPKVYVKYFAVQEGLEEVQKKAKELNASIHMPRIGVGLGGGKWDIVESIIVGSITSPVYVYDFS